MKKEKDPMGMAIADYYKNGTTDYPEGRQRKKILLTL